MDRNVVKVLLAAWERPDFREGLRHLIDLDEVTSLLAALSVDDQDDEVRRRSMELGRSALETAEIRGVEARHYPDTDTMEIDLPRIRAVNASGALIVATAKRAISNADGSEVQLIGDAVVTRDAPRVQGRPQPQLQIRGEFLHVFVEEERVRSHLPVVLRRGDDVFEGDSLAFDNLDRVLQLKGRVRGTISGDRGAN